MPSMGTGSLSESLSISAYRRIISRLARFKATWAISCSRRARSEGDVIAARDSPCDWLRLEEAGVFPIEGSSLSSCSPTVGIATDGPSIPSSCSGSTTPCTGGAGGSTSGTMVGRKVSATSSKGSSSGVGLDPDWPGALEPRTCALRLGAPDMLGAPGPQSELYTVRVRTKRVKL